MFHHCEPTDLFDFKPGQTGINITTEQCLKLMFIRKAKMDQIIIEKKTYEKNTQWVREMRKYPNHETFPVEELVLVYYPLGSL